MTAHFLCATCEDLLHRRGEKWVLANGYCLNGPSRLYEMLTAATPLPDYHSGTVYAGREIPGLDLDQISYFGISVFWRAAGTVWTNSPGEGRPFLSLGPYREQKESLDFLFARLGVTAAQVLAHQIDARLEQVERRSKPVVDGWSGRGHDLDCSLQQGY